MAESCCASGNEIMILACSGGSNVGQFSNQAAVELTQQGMGKMFCLAGIGGHLSGFVQSAKDVPVLVVIDGCEIGCAKAILERAQVPMEHYVVITALGIEKNKNLRLERADIDRVKATITQIVSENRSTPRGCGCQPGCC